MRVFMLGIAVAVAAFLPAVTRADDQQIADYVRNRLQAEQQQGNLRGFNVDMRVERGTVWFSGFVSDAAQEQLILRTAQQAGHLGVVQIVDDIEVRPAKTPEVAPMRMPQAVGNADYQTMPQMQPMAAQPAAYQAPQFQGAELKPMRQISQPMPASAVSAVPSAAISNQPLAFAASGMGSQGLSSQAPVPAMGAGSGGGPNMGTPNMPGYAWPGYAAHPNYAAVTYPRQYSPSAWPYIGPFYPYPQVPLGWRRVSLEWDDGWWYLDFQDKTNW